MNTPPHKKADKVDSCAGKARCFSAPSAGSGIRHGISFQPCAEVLATCPDFLGHVDQHANIRATLPRSQAKVWTGDFCLFWCRSWIASSICRNFGTLRALSSLPQLVQTSHLSSRNFWSMLLCSSIPAKKVAPPLFRPAPFSRLRQPEESYPRQYSNSDPPSLTDSRLSRCCPTGCPCSGLKV